MSNGMRGCLSLDDRQLDGGREGGKTFRRWGARAMISDPVWTYPPKSFMMASPILITMHSAADIDQKAHMVMNMEGGTKTMLVLW